MTFLFDIYIYSFCLATSSKEPANLSILSWYYPLICYNSDIFD